MKYFYYAPILIFLLTSCVTTNFTVLEIREPAYVSFAPEVSKITIVDNTPSYDFSKGQEEEEKKNDKRDNRPPIMSTDSARSVLLSHLEKFMNEEKYFTEVKLYPYRTNSGTTVNDVTPLSQRKAQSICRETSADALISFDLFAASAELETINTAYFSNYSVLGAKVGALIRVYSNEGRLLVPPMSYVDSLFREESNDWSRIKQNISEINSLVHEMSVVGADRLTAKFIPSWKSQERWYYSGGSSPMKEAAKAAKEGKWQTAANIWGSLFEKEKNKKKRMRLASNIALANEYLDDVDNALAWITIAFDLLPNKNNSELAIQIIAYKEILNKRAVNKARLQEQLGIDDNSASETEPIE